MKTYNSFGSRDPIWTRGVCDSEEGLQDVTHERVNIFKFCFSFCIFRKIFKFFRAHHQFKVVLEVD